MFYNATEILLSIGAIVKGNVLQYSDIENYFEGGKKKKKTTTKWQTEKFSLKSFPGKFCITASLLPQCSVIDINVVVAFLEILQRG